MRKKEVKKMDMKMRKLNRTDTFSWHWLVDAGLGTVGIGIFAFSVMTIAVPNGLASGGFTNFGIIANHVFGIDTGLVFWLLSAPLLLLAWRLLGHREAIMTLVVMNALTFWLSLFGNLNLPVFTMPNLVVTGIVAGILQGTGAGIVLISVTTSGGSLLTGRLAEHWFNIPVDMGILAIDVVGMSLAVMTFLNPSTAAATFLSLFIFAKVTRLVGRKDYRRKVFCMMRLAR